MFAEQTLNHIKVSYLTYMLIPNLEILNKDCEKSNYISWYSIFSIVENDNVLTVRVWLILLACNWWVQT